MNLKTLVVSYLPSGNISNTKRLLDAYLKISGNNNIEHLDLLKDPPDYFTEASLAAYSKRNYRGETLSEGESELLVNMDRMTAQIKRADIVVLVYPMYNHSFPASVKGYFDSVMQKGQTWDFGDVGLMKGKKALILTSAAADYTEGELVRFEFSISLAKAEFEYMGFSEIEVVSAEGLAVYSDRKENILFECSNRVRDIASKWLK